LNIESSDDHSRTDLAGTLRKLRKAAGLSGERLAVRCAMSQAKISRIERGKTLPTVLDVERILKALDVPLSLASELMVLARRANVQHTSGHVLAEPGLWRKQAELKASAESCEVQRLFLPAVPSGLLQVPDYARATPSPVVATSRARDVDRAVQARLDRQSVLDDPARQFVFVLTQQAVRWRYAAGRSLRSSARIWPNSQSVPT
jgi:transcriptional regulator with XRE-family HTH domain